MNCSIIGCVESSHADHREQTPLSECLSSSDPDVLHAALRREFVERWRAERVANMQADVVKLAIDLLVREPDIQSFFGALTRTMVEESESHVCAVWLIDDGRERCEMWMAYLEDRLYTSDSRDWTSLAFPHDALGEHLMAYKPGWTEAIAYESADARLPPPVQEFHRRVGVNGMVVAPLIIGSTTLGWLKLSDRSQQDTRGNRWWRMMLIEAIARQAALALHHSRVAERSRLEERRKTILEERNRLARDIHDNLAQGFGAILMQLQAAQRDMFRMPAGVSEKLKTAVDLARTHMIEARRSVGTLRPKVGSGEDLATDSGMHPAGTRVG